MTYDSSLALSGLAGPVGRPSVGMLSRPGSSLSSLSSLSPGAKVTLLKEGGGGSTGTPSTLPSSAATVLLLGTGAGEEESSGRLAEPSRDFLDDDNQKQSCLV